MQHYKQFEPLVIEDLTLDNWTHPRHHHNHYEFIYIMSGTGEHLIEEHIPYGPGDLFLLGPDDAHEFQVQTPTRFIFIKFTGAYPKDGHIQALEYLLKSKETHHRKFTSDETIHAIIKVLLTQASQQILWLQLFSLAIHLQQHMPEIKITQHRNRELQTFYYYLHQNIYYPGKTSNTALAQHFNTSPHTIGPWFKRQTGTTLRHYLHTYRKQLIMQRLATHNYTHQQLACEFHLTDESHLRKILKQ